MDVKMAFKNFDKTNRGVVTKTQFLSILTYLGIFPANPADRDLLCKAYQLREPGQGAALVTSLRFDVNSRLARPCSRASSFA